MERNSKVPTIYYVSSGKQVFNDSNLNFKHTTTPCTVVYTRKHNMFVYMYNIAQYYTRWFFRPVIKVLSNNVYIMLLTLGSIWS